MTLPGRSDPDLSFEDGALRTRDGRMLAWRCWGDAGNTPVLRMQGMPATRLQLNPGSTAHQELGVRYVMADRPGYGGSTRKPGRGIADLSADYSELLDVLGLKRVAVMGGSGGGPHALALAACRPERVSAVSIFSGATPPEPGEVARDWQSTYEESLRLRDFLLSEEGRKQMLEAVPLAVRTPEWERMSLENVTEAFRQGVEGWTDEVFAIEHEWDFDLDDVERSVTWWHAADDTIVPLGAARRAVDRMPHAQLRAWSGGGHLAFLTHDREILGELLERAT